jgi:3,4-dihydroxy-2-butanone 4-phosphate synthase
MLCDAIFVMNSVRAALAAVAAGEFVVVCDGEDRENEGDLIIAADKVSILLCCHVTHAFVCSSVSSSMVIGNTREVSVYGQ